MNKKLNLDDVKKQHQAGDLKKAKKGYLEILKTNPNNTEVLHLLGILYAEEGNLDEGQQYLEKAIALDPNAPQFSLHLANILKANGLYSRAIEVLLKVIQSHPNFAAAHNNLGTMYYAKAQLEEAVAHFKKAIELQPNYIDAYYNLALGLTKLNREPEAMTTYQTLLSLAPNHAAGQFQLGCLLMREDKTQEAIEHFSAILPPNFFEFETQTNLATCHLKLGHLNEAKVYYLQALDTHPNDLQVLFNLGVIEMQQGLIKESIYFYSRVVEVDPDLFDAHNNLAFAYLTLNERAPALLHFKEALRLQPTNESLRHTIHILSGEKNIINSPPEYVRSLFDSYADHYDAHLMKNLHYQVPQTMFNMVLETVSLREKDGAMLDLGCGTGLCAALFKPYMSSMVGVDLSEKMLDLAREKNLYDELIQSDIVSYLQTQHDHFDLIVAGDVFVYFGELTDVFAGVYQALKPNGLFVFNTEINTQENFKLLPSGRFSHHKTYLETLIRNQHFQVLRYQKIPMRTQKEEIVEGHLYLLQLEK